MNITAKLVALSTGLMAFILLVSFFAARCTTMDDLQKQSDRVKFESTPIGCKQRCKKEGADFWVLAEHGGAANCSCGGSVKELTPD